MFADFRNAFKNPSVTSKVPKEVLDHLNSGLPENFEYVSLKNGYVGLKPSVSDEMKLSMSVKLQIPEHIKIISSDELVEFLYRTQQELPVEGEFVKINGQSFNIADLIKFPFEEHTMISSQWVMVPEKFRAFDLHVEGLGVIRKMTVQRKPYADMERSLFKSIDESAFTIEYVFDESKSEMKFKCNITIEAAKNVKDIFESLTLFHAAYLGELKLQNYKLPRTQGEFEEGIEETISYWKKVMEIEERLDTTLQLKFPLTQEDDIWLSRLYRSFIEEKPYKVFLKLNELSMNVNPEFDVRKLETLPNLSLTVVRHETVKIMNSEFNLYFATGLYNLKISKVNKYENNLVNATLEEIDEKKMYQSVRIFADIEQARDFISKSYKELQDAETL